MAGPHPFHALMAKLHDEHPTLATYFESDSMRDVTYVSVVCQHHCQPRQMRELSWEVVRYAGEEVVRAMLRAIPCEHMKEPPPAVTPVGQRRGPDRIVIIQGDAFADNIPRVRADKAKQLVQKVMGKPGDFLDEERTQPRIEPVTLNLTREQQREHNVGRLIRQRYTHVGVTVSVDRNHPNLINSRGEFGRAIWAHLKCETCSANCGVRIDDDDDHGPRVQELFDLFEKARVCAHVPVYPTSEAASQNAIGTGSWSAGYFLEESSGNLSPTFGGEAAQKAPRYEHVETKAGPGSSEDATRALKRMIHDLIRKMIADMFPPIVAEALTFHEDEPIARVDGVGIDELLERYTSNQRSDGIAPTWPFTPAQLLLAQRMWTLQVKERTSKSAELDRNQVRVDVQDID